MAISINNLVISTKAAVGAPIGTLSLKNSSAIGIKANFMLTKNSAGFFAISGYNLVTAGASIPPGNYSVRIKANGTNTSLKGNATFVIAVTAT